MQRVVVTGMGAVSPYGTGVQALWSGLKGHQNRIVFCEELQKTAGLSSHICALVPELNEKKIPRKFRRTMSRMTIFLALAAQEALEQSALDPVFLSSGRVGVSMSSTVNSPRDLQGVFQKYLVENTGVEQIRSSSFFKIMNHGCAANLAQYLGISGRVISSAAACATSGQALILGAEAIAHGQQDVMFCGGADEVHPLTVGTFDMMLAASTEYNNRPQLASRPFDKDRDGVVCAEGGGVLQLESLEHALQRGAPILGEICGWSMTCSPSLFSPEPKSMQTCIQQALQNCKMQASEIDYINAHATSTIQGDVDEAQVLGKLFADQAPVSSLKGHLGHTMAASGALEIAATFKMMQEDILLKTLNLENIDDNCMGMDLICEDRKQKIDTVLKNNFAFGGINTALIIRRYK